MGTPKQVEALMSLARKACIKSNRPFNEALYREGVAAASNAQVQEEFKKWNGLLGFDRASSPCTDKQAELIRDLEGQLLGGAQTDWTTFRVMTYEDADVRIKRLLADLKAKRTDVTFSALVAGLNS